MSLGLFLVIAGLVFAPFWAYLFAGPITIPYCIGLALVAAGGVSLLSGILKALRPGRLGRLAGMRLKLSLLALTLLAGYLFLEAGASAAIVLGGKRGELFEFRRRQRFENDPLKIAHPFLILTNNPKMAGINSLGFLDQEWPREKAPGTIRIACLGASTSEDGYPRLLQEDLALMVPGMKFEVMNFGNAGWTTAQSLINYCLNVKYFSPDYLILINTANEVKVRGYGDFRTDYSHAFKIMERPRLRRDAPLLRYFNSYALSKMLYYKWCGINPGLSVYEVMMRPNEHPADIREDELLALRENILEIVNLAGIHGTKVILASEPYSKTNISWGEHFLRHMKQANDVVRSIAADRGAVLVDLDAQMGGREDYFVDPVHLSPEAVALKSKILADAIAPLLKAGAK